MKRKTKFKTGHRTTCEYCRASIAHNRGSEKDIYCSKCKKLFEDDDLDVYLWETLIGHDPAKMVS